MRLKTLLLIGLITCLLSCASEYDPFFYVPVDREEGNPPPCFVEPLTACVEQELDQTKVQNFSSPWRFSFYPDLNHRICRGDQQAQKRLLQGVREFLDQEEPRFRKQFCESFISDCSSKAFCEWARQIAKNLRENLQTRMFFLDMLRKNCDVQINEELFALPDAPSEREHLLSLGPGRYSTNENRCKNLEHHPHPWTDLVKLYETGCLDLMDWLKQHRDEIEGTCTALERCILENKIRYQEADCLHALAVIDRNRALSFLRQDRRRAYGSYSRLTFIARTLLRFPEPGHLEAELRRLGLVPEEPAPEEQGKLPPILPKEILEAHRRLLHFNPSCSVRYCEHAPLLYKLADLAAPELDDVIFEERWPALEQVDFGDGTQQVATTIRGIPVTFNVREDHGDFHRGHLEDLKKAVEGALSQSHIINAYVDGEVYRLRIRNLGEWYDLEAVIGGLNSILAARKSSLRFVSLEPNCFPCAEVLAGPRDGLIRAAFQGLIEVVDPFKNMWTAPSFDPRLLDQGDRP